MRDIEKDKAYLDNYDQVLINNHPLIEIGFHWIAQYEAAQSRIHELEELLRKDSEKTP
jgi:hypothetical protein